MSSELCSGPIVGAPIYRPVGLEGRKEHEFAYDGNSQFRVTMAMRVLLNTVTIAITLTFPLLRPMPVAHAHT